MEERCIYTWKNIAAFLNVSSSKARRFKKELLGCGAVFIDLKRMKKKSGDLKPFPQRVIAAFPSNLMAWIATKSSKGEVFTPKDRKI